MSDVVAKHPIEMAAAEDEDVIETFVADGTHPALGDRVRLRRPHRGLEQTHTLGADELVERPRELGVTVVQPEADPIEALLDGEVARLLAQ